MNKNLRAQTIAAEARSWIGTPYRHQAACKGAGADCLGLVRGVWRRCIGPEPEIDFAYARDRGEYGPGEPVLGVAEERLVTRNKMPPLPGDLLIFRWRRAVPAKHLGIMSDQDLFVHAYERAGVCETRLSGFWGSKMVAVFRFPGVDE